MYTVWVGGPWDCLTTMLNVTVYVWPLLADLMVRVVWIVSVACEVGTLPLRLFPPDRDELTQEKLGFVETWVQESAEFLKKCVRSMLKGEPIYTI